LKGAPPRCSEEGRMSHSTSPTETIFIQKAY
jgi:hypothetical protein